VAVVRGQAAMSFSFAQWQRVKEGLHWGFAEAPAALIRAPFIVFEEPDVEVGL